ncbi:MAG: hypothetical protein AB2A00_04980 [Myxococcota bacterium]
MDSGFLVVATACSGFPTEVVVLGPRRDDGRTQGQDAAPSTFSDVTGPPGGFRHAADGAVRASLV